MCMGTVVDDSLLAHNNAAVYDEFKAYLELQ